MSIKKLLLLAGMALAAVAFMAPASASANVVFTHEHEPLLEEVEIEGTGTASFSSGLGGLTCEEAHAKVLLKPGSTAVGTSFIGTTGDCQGVGAFAGCTTKDNENDLVGEPVIHTTTETDLTITNVELYTELEGPECAFEDTRLTFHDLTGTLFTEGKPNTDTVDTITIEDNETTGIAHVAGLELTGVEAHANLTIVDPDKHTYGIAHAE